MTAPDLPAFLLARIDDAEATACTQRDPARVLAECAARRRVVELHAIVHRDIGWLEEDDGEVVEMSAELRVCGLCVPKYSHFRARSAVPVGACLTVRLLAQPYASHPDFDPAWRV